MTTTPVEISTVLEIELSNGIAFHANSIEELRCFDFGGETVSKISIVQVTKQEINVEDVLCYNRIENGANHEAPWRLQ